MRKIPSKILKASKDQQRKWVADEIKQIEDYAEELRRFSRSIILDKNFVPRVDERPDLPIELEPEAFAD